MERTRKTSTICLRIERHAKEKLATIAAKEGRTLSSQICQALHGFLELYEGGLSYGAIHKERRKQAREEILLPARWRMKLGEREMEKDVIVKNISATGAYTEYINGKNFSLLRDLQSSTFSLVVRLPRMQEAIELDSEIRRIQISDESVKVALRFIDILNEESLMD